MNTSTFTLVHRGRIVSNPVSASGNRLAQGLPDLKDALETFRPKYDQLKGSLLASMDHLDATHVGLVATRIQAIAAELNRQPEVTTVGVWDLGARVARLPLLIERLNAAQTTFVFFEIEAGIPSGLISQPERMVTWANERLGNRLRREDEDDMVRNLIANDFFPRAELVRSDLGVDYIVGLTPSMVAGQEDDGSVYWNHFSTFEGRAVLASVQDLRTFAKEAGKSFEVLIGGVLVAQLLVAMFHHRGLGFHEDRKCLFDYNESRVSIIEAAKSPCIEPECLKLIPSAFRESADRLVETLRTFTLP
jgi:hypothetical protein